MESDIIVDLFKKAETVHGLRLKYYLTYNQHNGAFDVSPMLCGKISAFFTPH